MRSDRSRATSPKIPSEPSKRHFIHDITKVISLEMVLFIQVEQAELDDLFRHSEVGYPSVLREPLELLYVLYFLRPQQIIVYHGKLRSIVIYRELRFHLLLKCSV